MHMSRGDKRRVAAGLLILVIGAGGFALLRHRLAQQALRLRATDGSTFHGVAGGAVETPPHFETADEVAAEVAASLGAWREAILVKNADTVIALDRTFLNSPDRYRAALAESAQHDTDERVRAFSTRVLGKYKRPSLAELFETLLADKSPFVRQNAAWALGELGALDDGRAAAKRAVAELRHARAKDPAPDVRAAAKGALARLE